MSSTQSIIASSLEQIKYHTNLIAKKMSITSDDVEVGGSKSWFLEETLSENRAKVPSHMRNELLECYFAVKDMDIPKLSMDKVDDYMRWYFNTTYKNLCKFANTKQDKEVVGIRVHIDLESIDAKFSGFIENLEDTGCNKSIIRQMVLRKFPFLTPIE